MGRDRLARAPAEAELGSVSRRIADALIQSGRAGPPLTVTVGQVAAEFGVPAAAAAVRTCLRGGPRELDGQQAP